LPRSWQNQASESRFKDRRTSSNENGQLKPVSSTVRVAGAKTEERRQQLIARQRERGRRRKGDTAWASDSGEIGIVKRSRDPFLNADRRGIPQEQCSHCKRWKLPHEMTTSKEIGTGGWGERAAHPEYARMCRRCRYDNMNRCRAKAKPKACQTPGCPRAALRYEKYCDACRYQRRRGKRVYSHQQNVQQAFTVAYALSPPGTIILPLYRSYNDDPKERYRATCARNARNELKHRIKMKLLGVKRDPRD
jgi:hypothetical protein